MAQDNTLKFYTMIDALGRLVPGSSVIRKTKPKAGRWHEENLYVCCNPAQTITATPSQTSGSVWDFELSCSGAQIFLLLPFTATDINDLVKQLNKYAGYLGQFDVADNGTDITLALVLSIAQNMCGTNAITMSIGLD